MGFFRSGYVPILHSMELLLTLLFLALGLLGFGLFFKSIDWFETL